MKTKKEIKETLREEMKHLTMYNKMDNVTNDEYISQGWVEALDWVLKKTKKNKK